MQYNLAVVMPTGGISFYLDRPGVGNVYGRFVGSDLPDDLQSTFALARDREDTIIAGNSMGGFGALHTALACPERFGCAIGPSSALVIYQVAERTPDGALGHPNVMADYAYYRETFGDPAGLLEGENNPETLVKKRKAEERELPRLFMACGTEDFLLEQNRALSRLLKDAGVPVTYVEDAGVHDWAF